MVASLVACGTSENPPDQTDNTAETPTTENETVMKIKAEPYDGVFKVGFGRADVTPKFPITLQNGNVAKKSQDPLYTTCVAVNDGETTALIFTIDAVNISDEICASIRGRVNLDTKIAKENIIISATHNHSTPTPGVKKDTNSILWVTDLGKKSSEAAKEAIADLTDADIYLGTSGTKGMAFVRRYVHEDGSHSGIWSSNKTKSPIVSHETEADDLLQVMRFVRDGKKDIVIANWQGHLADAIGTHTSVTTGDLAYYMRYVTESEDEDVLFAYYSGASANVNLTAKIPSLKKYRNYQDVGMALGKAIVSTFDDLTRVEAGKIGIENREYTAKVLKDTPETIAKAKEAEAAAQKAANDAGVNIDSEKGKDIRNDVLATYGFSTYQETTKLISRNENLGDTVKLDIRAISFGDVAFVAAPYEMFDTNGMEIKAGSPYTMTFVLSCAGGSWGYIPAAHAVPNGGYEVYSTRFVYGTAESLVSEYLDMLRELAMLNVKIK